MHQFQCTAMLLLHLVMSEEDRISFSYHALPALPVFCTTFPMLLPHAYEFLLQLAASCLAHCNDPFVEQVHTMITSGAMGTMGTQTMGTTKGPTLPSHTTTTQTTADAMDLDHPSHHLDSIEQSDACFEFDSNVVYSHYETNRFTCLRGTPPTKEHLLAFAMQQVYRRLLLCIQEVEHLI